MKFIAIYAADEEDRWINPATGKCWNVPCDREYFREKIKNKTIICGRKTYEADWKGFEGARRIIVLSKELKVESDYKLPQTSFKTKPIDALELAMQDNWQGEIYLVGGKTLYNLFRPMLTAEVKTTIARSGNFTRRLTDFTGKKRIIPDLSRSAMGEDEKDGHCKACEL